MTRLLRVAVVVLFCAPLFVGLGHADLVGDEPIYSYAVDAMLANGDWMTPRYIPEQTAFLEKPPLKFWIIAAGIRTGLLPNTEFGHRFWDALFGSLAFLYVFAIGRRLAGPICGFVSVFVLFVYEPLLFEHGLRSNNMEAALVFAYCGGIYHALAWSTAATPRARRLHPLAVGALFALAFMCKFVAALFLPMVLVVASLVLPQWRRRALDDWRPWGNAALVAIAIVSPWFAYQSIVHGRMFWDLILREHVVKRMSVALEPGHVGPWYYYVTRTYAEAVLNGSVGLVAVGLVVMTWQTVRRRWDEGALILLWFLLPFVLLSAGRTKLYHYAYPFLPPLALAAGFAAIVIFDSGSRGLRMFESVGAWIATRLGFITLRGRPWWRALVMGIAIVAFAVAAWTVVHGRFGIRVGEVVLFRNRSVLRPLAISAILLIVLGRSRLAARLALSLLVLSPLAGYATAMTRLNDGTATLQELRGCLQQQQQQRGSEAPRFLMHGDPGQWRYVYYFRHLGWKQSDRSDDRPLIDHLLTPGRDAPAIIHARDAARIPGLAQIPSVRVRRRPVVVVARPVRRVRWGARKPRLKFVRTASPAIPTAA